MTRRSRGRAEVPIWGTSTTRREFLPVDDLADACVFLIEGRERNVERKEYKEVTGVAAGVQDLDLESLDRSFDEKKR